MFDSSPLQAITSTQAALHQDNKIVGSIYLIRHGQASFGADNYDVLSARGTEQAKILGRYLAGLGIDFDAAYAGTLERQQSTAASALGQLAEHNLKAPSVTLDAGFNEYLSDEVIRAYMPDLLEYEPNAQAILHNAANQRAEFQRLFAFVINRWAGGQHPREGLQSWQGFVDQVQAALTKVLAKAQAKDRIAIFTSGGTITAAMQLVLGLNPLNAFELNWQIVNTSVSVIKFRNTQMAVASFNSAAHLEQLNNPDLITYR